MAGVDDAAGPSHAATTKAEESDDGSEDLEAESSGSEDEEIEEEEGEGEGEGDGDEDMEMADDGEKAPEAVGQNQQPIGQQPNGEVMVH